MTTISGISSCSQYSSASQVQSVSGGRSGNRTNPLEQRLDEVLSTTSLDDTQKASLKSDLKSAVDEVIQSGSFPPDPSAVKDAVSSVFEKYGLDAQDLASKLGPSQGGRPQGGPPPGGPPPGGPPPSGSSSSEDSSAVSGYEDQQTTDIQKLIQNLLDKLNDVDDSNNAQTITDYLSTALVGFDKSA